MIFLVDLRFFSKFMKNAKLSVIIPAFNADKYISRAIDSVLHQTLKDIEFVIVDDGSIDNTANIVKSFGERVKYYYQENKGVAEARNLGKANSNGEYIAFLDADDYVLPETYEKLLKIAQQTNADIVTCNFVLENENGLRRNAFHYLKNEYYLNKRNDIAKAFRILGNSCCNKIYRGSLIQNIRFPNLKIGEDAIFVLESFLRAKKMVYTNEPLYVYFQNSLSVTKDIVNLIRIENYKQIQSKKRELICKYNFNELLESSLQDYYIKTFLMYANRIRRIQSINERHSCWRVWLTSNKQDYLKNTSLRYVISLSENIHWVYYVGMIITGKFIEPVVARLLNIKFYFWN